MPKPLPESHRDLCDYLKMHPSWGYVIYRTTYSAESNAHFPTVIRYLEACVKKEFFADSISPDGSVEGDPAIYEELWARHNFTIMDDAAQFDGASIDSVRTHFQAWVDAQGQRDKFNQYRMCMVIDAECLQTLLGTSAEALEQETWYVWDETVRYVKVLEAWPIVDQYDDFPGWMKSWSRALWDLWKMMGAFSEMRSSWWRINDSEKGLYGQ